MKLFYIVSYYPIKCRSPFQNATQPVTIWDIAANALFFIWLLTDHTAVFASRVVLWSRFPISLQHPLGGSTSRWHSGSAPPICWFANEEEWGAEKVEGRKWRGGGGLWISIAARCLKGENFNIHQCWLGDVNKMHSMTILRSPVCLWCCPCPLSCLSVHPH